MKEMGYPSAADAKAALGSMANPPCAPKAVDHAIAIWGPSIGDLKGKTVRYKSAIIDPSIEVKKGPPEDLTMHADVMFVESIPFLVSVTTPLGYTIGTPLTGSKPKSGPSLLSALQQQRAEYRSYNYDVKQLYFDSDSALSSVTTEIQNSGVNVTPHGPNQHVPIVERKIRVIKERVRAHLHSLPYTLPYLLLCALVLFCIGRINMLASSSGHVNHSVPPVVALTGRPLDAKTDVRVGFGDYCQGYNTKLTSTNGMDPRTDGLIALGPSKSRTGSVRFLSLATGRTTVRDQFIVLPTPDVVIQHMNKVAASQRFQVSKDPTFKLGHQALDDIAEVDHYFVDAAADTVEPVAAAPTAMPIHADDLDSDVLLAQDFPPLTVDAPPPPATSPESPVHRSVADMSNSPVSRYEPIVNADNTVNAQASPRYRSEHREAGISPVNNNTGHYHTSTTSTAEHNMESDYISPTSLEFEAELDADDISMHLPDLEPDPDVEEPSAPLETTMASEPDPPNHQQPQQSLRRSERVRRPNPRYANFLFKRRLSHQLALHISLGKALKMYEEKAEEEIKRELQQMIGKQVWKAVDYSKLTLAQRKSIIRSSFFLKEKFLPSGAFDKLKGRLVAGGNMQDKTLYGDDISSPTVSISSILMVAAIAAMENRHVVTLDVAGAYLNASLDAEVFMSIEPRLAKFLIELDPTAAALTRPDGSLVVQLRKALYGCVESAKLWYLHIAQTLREDGYIPNPLDPCVFNKGSGKDQTTITLYVDDLMITSRNRDLIDKTIAKLKETYVDIKVQDSKVLPYVGMNFDFSKQGEVSVTMDGYIADVLELYNITDTAATPATPHLYDIDERSPPLKPADRKLFHLAVAKLLYLAKRVRPEILPLCSFLATRVNSATDQDMSKLRRGLAYLNAYRTLGIVLRPGNSPFVNAYIDASYAVHSDFKSQSGVVICVGDGPIYVESSKQKLVSKSSTEAELIALSDGISQVIWTRQFLENQGYTVPPATVHQDNMSTIALANNGRSNAKKTRHINIRYFFVVDRIENAEIEVRYLPSEKMVADILTKPLQGSLFRYLRSRLLG